MIVLCDPSLFNCELIACPEELKSLANQFFRRIKPLRKKENTL